MLILTREVGERIRIGEDIVIVVSRIDYRHGESQVKIGIEAPRDVVVHREEVYQAIKAKGG